MIETITKRRKLTPRKTPYWHKLSVGKFIGFYRTDDGGTWHARTLIDGKRYFQPIGGDMDSDFEDMLKIVHEWIEKMQILDNPESVRHTVKSVVEDYIRHLEIEKSSDSAYRTRLQLEKHLIPTLGKAELYSLTANRFKSWRDSMIKRSDDTEEVRKSKDSANRVLSMAKAAFNLAFRDGSVPSDVAWRRVDSFKKVGKERTLFLTDNQVGRLLEKTSGGFHDLIEAAILTGARYGELVAAKVKDFDSHEGTLYLSGKTGGRNVYLSDASVKALKRMTKDKLPEAWVLTKDNGEHWGKGHQHRPMKRAVRTTKLPHETVFYSLRHYHISKALKAGIQHQVVAENTGTSIRMLEKHYAKFMKADRREMFNSIDLGVGL